MNNRGLKICSVILLAGVAVYLSTGCRPKTPARAAETVAVKGSSLAVQRKPLGLDSFVPRPIGRPPDATPLITDLLIVDLDQDGLKDVLVSDGGLNKVSWIRQV